VTRAAHYAEPIARSTAALQRPLRVAYVTMGFPVPYETFAAFDVRALAKAGVDITVHSLRPAHPTASRLAAERGLEHTPLTYNSLRSSGRGLTYALRRPLVFLRLIAWLIRGTWRTPSHLVRSVILAPRAMDIMAALAADPPDIVHLFWGHYPVMVGHLVRRHIPGPKLSVFLGAYDLEWDYGCTEEIVRGADVVWTHARANLPDLIGLGAAPERIHVVHRGVDLSPFRVQRPPKTPGRITCIGRLMAGKAFNDVIEAFAQIIRRAPHATLVIIGDGPEREPLGALARTLGVEHAVTFAGHIPHAAVRAELATTEIFLYLSRSKTDRLPNVVKEAMASGCVCVVSRTAGIDELVEDGVHGFVVDYGDIAGAVERVDWAFRHPTEARAIAQAGEARVYREFDVDVSMGEYRRQWEQLASPSHG
jgi:colanic acid/amylovoran biosynthesis glycosyltransferase